MLLQCRACGNRITTASLEPVFFMGLVVPFVGLPISGVQQLSQRYGWYIWLIAGPLLLPFLLLGAVFFLVWGLMKLIVYLSFFWRKCPTCGSRKWTWPITEHVTI